MESRDNELSVDTAAEEAALRRLLEAYDEPQPVFALPGLAERVITRLPTEPPAVLAVARRRAGIRRRITTALYGALAFMLLAIGAWGVLLDSSGPARLFGEPSGGLARLVLLLTLAAKPLVNLLLAAGPLLPLGLLLFAGSAWLWWRIVRREPLAVAEGV